MAAAASSPPSDYELPEHNISQFEIDSDYRDNDNVGSGPIDDNEMLLAPFSTLDEPVKETIMRDVRAVVNKLRVVLLPLDRTPGYDLISSYAPGAGDSAQEAGEDRSQTGEFTPPTSPSGAPSENTNEKRVINTLREWDLWGPLLVCLTLSVLLSTKAHTSNDKSAIFAAVFMAVWVGSTIVTINATLLGATISFFQAVCVLGYSLFPMMLAALLETLLRHTWFGYVWINFIWVVVGFIWATRASTVFFGQYVKPERRALVVFPVCFFYTFIGWMILLL